MEEKQPEEGQLRQQSEMQRATAQPEPHLRHHPQRDEDAEALQQALLESEECVPRACCCY